MYMPYEPYIGCMDGALDELDRVIRLCEKYSISILLDLHAMRGSQVSSNFFILDNSDPSIFSFLTRRRQNGMDNSGNTDSYEWVSTVSQSGAARYKHWEIRGGSWAGSFNQTTKQYDSIDRDNIARSLQVVEAVIARHKDDSPIVGLEPSKLTLFEVSPWLCGSPPLLLPPTTRFYCLPQLAFIAYHNSHQF